MVQLASISDYVAKTWPIGLSQRRAHLRFRRQVSQWRLADDDLPDAGEPTGGYLWKNFATHASRTATTANSSSQNGATKNQRTRTHLGPPKIEGVTCTPHRIKKVSPRKNVGDSSRRAKPLSLGYSRHRQNIASEVELRGTSILCSPF